VLACCKACFGAHSCAERPTYLSRGGSSLGWGSRAATHPCGGRPPNVACSRNVGAYLLGGLACVGVGDFGSMGLQHKDGRGDMVYREAASRVRSMAKFKNSERLSNMLQHSLALMGLLCCTHARAHCSSASLIAQRSRGTAPFFQRWRHVER